VIRHILLRAGLYLTSYHAPGYLNLPTVGGQH